MTLQRLPIDAMLPEIVALLREQPALLISAPPGAGKTTRVPRILYQEGFAEKGEILVLEPRRLAARLAAARVAQELGEKIGETVGYSIRFESVASPRTRIRFLTEGVFSRRIIQDPMLQGVSAVILDEFHERNLASDLAIAFLRELQTRKPDIKLVVMSATMESEALAAFLDKAPIVSGEGSCFEIGVEYADSRRDGGTLEEKVVAAVSRLLREKLDGDILVFLPGAAEIRRSSEALKPFAKRADFFIAPLHGDLPSRLQAHAIQPSSMRKIILSTNVAETSVTIPGIGAVIDSGLARIAGYSAWSGLPRLYLRKISRASAEQRAGRAGRTQPGKVIRLYSRYDFQSRPEREVPEIKRADLAETILTLYGAGIQNIRTFPWFEEPPSSAIDAAENLLGRLGALDGSGFLTTNGRLMLRFPVHPRLARLIIEGEKYGIAEDSILLAVLLAERDIRLDKRSSFHSKANNLKATAVGSSDLIEMMDRFREAGLINFNRRRVLSLGLDTGAVERVERARQQLTRFLTQAKQIDLSLPDSWDEAIRLAILTAFPDRVAKRSGPNSRTFVLAAGGSGKLSETSIVHKSNLIVAVDAEERVGAKGSSHVQGVVVRLASSIEPSWLFEQFPDEIDMQVSLRWNEAAGRVDEVKRTCYGHITLEDSVYPAALGKETSDLLAAQVLSRGLSIFSDGDRIPELKARLALVARFFPREKIHELGEDEVRNAVRQLCNHKRSLSELSGLSLINELLNYLETGQQTLLFRETPDRIRLRAGKSLKVHYHPAKPPWIEARLQNLFGMTKPPTICSGQVVLTVHLLAPNGRPVQVTQDLAGFWRRHYPALRRELQRRYPKHPWPQ